MTTLPPLRKKTSQERASARLPEGEDLTFALFGERAIIEGDAAGAMSEDTEWQWQNELPGTDEAKALRDLAQVIAAQTAVLARLAGNEETADLERLLMEAKVLTYGKQEISDTADTNEPGEDSGSDEEEISYP